MTDRWFSERGARAALAADDGPRDRGDRRRRPRRGAAPVRGDEARVADAARPDGGRRARPRLLHPAAPRRRGRRRGLDARAWAAAGAATTTRSSRSTGASSSSCSPRPGARTRARASGPNPGSFTITEDEEKVTFTMNPCGSGPAAGAQRRLRGPARRRRHARGARLVVRPQGLPALLHALQLHERVDADPVVGLPAVPLRPAARTTPRTRAPGTGTRTPTTIPERHWSATARSSRAGRPRTASIVTVLRGSRCPGRAAPPAAPGCSRRTGRRAARPRAPHALALGELDEALRRRACCASARRGSARASASRRGPCSRRPG